MATLKYAFLLSSIGILRCNVLWIIQGFPNNIGVGMKICIHNSETDRYMAGDGTWQPRDLAVSFDRVLDAFTFCSASEERNVEIVVSFGTKEDVHIPLHQIDD